MSDPARNERHRRSVRESGETVALELQDALVRYAIGLGLTPQDAEDAVQSAFRQLYSTRPDLDSAEAWLKTVIESRSVDRARRERTAEKYRDTEKGAAPRTPVVPDLDTGIW